VEKIKTGLPLQVKPGLLLETREYQFRRMASLNCLGGITSLGLLRVEGKIAIFDKKNGKIYYT
jgi:hypothetical protein